MESSLTQWSFEGCPGFMLPVLLLCAEDPGSVHVNAS